MKYRKLDENGDYSFGHQSADFWIDDSQAERQAIETRLNLWVGDWFLDLTEGTDWRAKVLGKYTSSTYDPEIRTRILGTQGVASITQYYSALDRTARQLHVSATVNTLYTGTKDEAFILSVTIVPPSHGGGGLLRVPLGQFVLGTTEMG